MCVLHFLCIIFVSFSCLVVFSYFGMFVFYLSYCIIIPWTPVCFPLRDRRSVDLDGKTGGEELGGVRGGETIN